MPFDDDVDLGQVILVGSGLYTGLTAILHPLSVIKTRAQAASSATSLGRVEAVRAMIATSGVRGLFAGLVPVLSGAVPARATYILALESVRPRAAALARQFGFDGSAVDAISGGAAGLAAASSSMLIYVPVDVVSQRMMVVGDPTAARATGAAVSARPSLRGEVTKILAASGWRGLFNGLGVSLALGLPAGSIWWAAYSSSREIVPGLLPQTLPPRARGPTERAAAGTFASLCTVSVVAPIDTIKVHTQLQAAGTEPAWQLAARLVRRDGLASLYAGFAPRVLHLSLFSTALVSVYEWLRITCRRRPPPQDM
jgi:hypothetical protein